MNNKKGYIYCYTYLPNGEKYIGQTTNIEKRKKEHLQENRVNLRFHNLLRKHYQDFNFIILEENINIENLDNREKFWIKYYNTFEGLGFNLTEGGDGGFTACQNYWKNNPDKMQEHIKKIQPLAAEAAKKWRQENPEKEKERIKNLHQKANEWRINNPEKAKQQTENLIELGRKWKQEHKEECIANAKKMAENNKKKVICITTNIIYNSIKEASEQTGVCASNIGRCCHGRCKSAGKTENNEKLIWRFIE